jgi:amidohydrolase
MMSDKQKYLQTIEENASLFTDVSDQIWDFAELSLMEFQSAKLYCEVLAKEGFTVETPIAGIETAFKASYGSGKPVIGILAEYDALTGLSQQAGAVERKELVSGGCGHGCGHNMLGAGSLAAAFAIKKYLEDGHSGTIIFYGCPGEEGGAAKAFMARDGLWKQLDAALTWHPEDCNEVITGGSNACIQVQYTFHGVASHAAGAPELGRSALDAVELMNIGVQFLREHMTDDARIHYAILDAGGRSPNVVQSASTVLYMVRSKHVAEAVKLQARVDKIADGAALMTETSYTRKFIDGTADCLPNRTLETLMHENFAALGVPQYTPEELDFAKKLAATYPSNQAVPGTGSRMQADYARKIRALQQTSGHAMNDFLLPYFTGEAFRAGSTDVGDVSWLCPTAQCSVASIPNGCPGHSWQIVSCGTTSIAHKAALHAGRVIACTAIDLFAQPERLAQAKAEFDQAAEGGYVCPIPPDAVPVVAD